MEQDVYERMSIEDRMTGMKNRKAFEQQMDQIEQDVMLLENALLIFIDIANLKTINDTYGMQIGDEAVIRTARSIQAAESAACEQHTECFRIAGDEFAIVVTRSLKVLAIPRHSPVYFISCPKLISAPRIFSNENTGILMAKYSASGCKPGS